MASSNSRRERRQQQKEDEKLIDIVQATDQAQTLYEQYSTYILGGVFLIVLIIGGLFAYNNFYVTPRNDEAIRQMSQAQIMFEQDSFQQALVNPGGGFPGFADIADDYSGTKAANLALYYAGICYLNIGEFGVALDYLDDYDPQGAITPIMKYGAMGDAFSEIGNFDNAMKYYKRAVKQAENDLLVPYYMKKIGLLHEKNGNFAEAKEMYQSIKAEYPNSPDGTGIQKYISRVEGK